MKTIRIRGGIRSRQGGVMAIKQFTVIRFTSRGREYEVDERLITTIDKHRSEKDAHHIYLTDGTYFCATNVAWVNLIRQVQELRR
ncbi:hypothetical protein EAMG_05547 [Escherichia coli M056]|nr:hypothetical protein EAMG_05612 [Escherichia coli M056]OSK10465.1 hypothetical protein EAMG_05547 [Escherichia coli M056]